MKTFAVSATNNTVSLKLLPFCQAKLCVGVSHNHNHN